MSINLRKLIIQEMEKLSEKEKQLLKDKLKKKQKEGKFTSESLLKIIGEEVDSLNEAGVDKVKNELVKVIVDLKKNFVLYKKAKLSDNNKDMDRFKKIALNLTKRKKELEKELDRAIGGLYADAELQLEGRGKKVTKQWWKKASEDDRERAMLSVVKDPDDIDYDLVDGKWEDLDGWMQRDMYFFEGEINEKGKGLWHNIRAKRARGEAPARKGSKAYKKAKKAADDINASESVNEKAIKGKDAGNYIKMAPKGRKLHILGTKDGSDQRDFISLGKGKWQEKRTGKKLSWVEVSAIASALGDTKVFYEGKLNEVTAKDTLQNAVNALTKTIGGKKFDKGYVKDYLKSIERMARKNPGTFVKDYGDFKVGDWIEDVRYNMQNEGK